MGKVRFDEDQCPQTPLPPTVLPSSAVLSVKLGFLSCGGIYTSPILEIGDCSPVVSGLQVSNLSTECQQQAGQPASLVLRFWADRPGPFETTFLVRLPDQQQEVSVNVTATVMPRNKGTPGLKPLVHCVGFTCETDTETASDWHGFD